LISSYLYCMENKNLFNRKYLKSFRSSLRNKSTSAEAVLWNILKSKNLNGRKFRRQHSIGNYIVDFFCASEELVIELDGNQHGEYHKIEKDKKRDQYLEGLGFSILQSTTPAGINICIMITFWSGHPSFKRKGKLWPLYSVFYILL
jgi:very-short-patch-repair endonuclease